MLAKWHCFYMAHYVLFYCDVSGLTVKINFRMKKFMLTDIFTHSSSIGRENNTVRNWAVYRENMLVLLFFFDFCLCRIERIITMIRLQLSHYLILCRCDDSLLFLTHSKGSGTFTRILRSLLSSWLCFKMIYELPQPQKAIITVL